VFDKALANSWNQISSGTDNQQRGTWKIKDNKNLKGKLERYVVNY
jgi:hypothetical protein